MRKHWQTDWINLELWAPNGLPLNSKNTRPFLTFSTIVRTNSNSVVWEYWSLRYYCVWSRDFSGMRFICFSLKEVFGESDDQSHGVLCDEEAMALLDNLMDHLNEQRVDKTKLNWCQIVALPFIKLKCQHPKQAGITKFWTRLSSEAFSFPHRVPSILKFLVSSRGFRFIPMDYDIFLLPDADGWVGSWFRHSVLWWCGQYPIEWQPLAWNPSVAGSPRRSSRGRQYRD